jgi:hypothetical protein
MIVVGEAGEFASGVLPVPFDAERTSPAACMISVRSTCEEHPERTSTAETATTHRVNRLSGTRFTSSWG